MEEETTTRSKIKIILLIVLGILIVAGLVAGAYWLGTGKTKKKEESKKTSSYPSAWTQKTEDKTEEKTENQIDPATLEYETWNSDKEGLTLKYPKTWVKSVISDMSQVATKEEIDKYKLSMPLIVSFPSMEKLLQITVTRYEFADDRITDIIATLIKEAQKKATSVTIVDQKNNERVLVMENKYKKDELELHTKEKMILLTAQGSTLPGYIISFSTLEKDWLEYKKVVEFVIDSALLTDGSIINIEAGSVGKSSVSTKSTGQSSTSSNQVTDEKNLVNVKDSHFSELYLAKIPKTASEQTTAPTKASEFDLSTDKICIVGKTSKEIEKIETNTYDAKTKAVVQSNPGSSLAASEDIRYCEESTLTSGTYDLEFKVNNQTEKMLRFTVK